MYSRIRIPAKWRDTHPDYYGEKRLGVADFKLGLGTCGKVVSELDYSEDRDSVRVFQTCEDGEKKVFVYPRFLLTGRIELTML